MKKLIIVLLALTSSLGAFAQQDLTLYNARYLQQAGFTNPAFRPECKVNIGGILFGSFHYSSGNSGFTTYRLTKMFESPEEASNGLDKMQDANYLSLNLRKDIIHFGFRIADNNYISLNLSARSQNTFLYPRDVATLAFMGNGLSEAEAAELGVSNDYALIGKRANLDGFGVESSTFAEIGLQYQRHLLEDKLSIGIRPKLLLGVANVNTTDFAMGLHTDEDNFQLTFDGTYAYNTSLPFVTEEINDSTSETSFEWEPFANLGWGVDLGASYNITERFSVSASAIDIGQINWKNNPRNYEGGPGEINYTGIPVSGSILNVGSSLDSAVADFVDQLSTDINEQFSPDTTENEYKTWVGARYNLGANFQINDKSDVGVLLNSHFVKRKMRAAFTVSYNFRVRKWFGFHANYSIYNRSFLNIGTGLSFNIFPWQFYVMSDNVIGWVPFVSQFSKNRMVRIGINWTFGCQDDRDKDGILDKEDLCPDTPGEAKFKGCPDTDKDGIEDRFDKCPETPGSKEMNGCPDRDGDGIADDQDDCPDAPGVAEFNGCPDSDGDGIKDSEDACPTVAGVPAFDGCPDTDGDNIQDSEDDCPEEPGIPEFNGCPDTDGDGLQDSEDDCPEKAGPVEQKGCPDTDGDGLTDNVDGCPETPGPVDNMGCPFGDRDGDGVIDKDDSCPDTPGPAENAGCPYSDLDGDGVYDKDDRCPQTPGVVENAGCPEIKQEEQEVLNTAFANLEFETGSDVIKSSSFESLNGLADLLIKKDQWKLQISGHTDNVGSESANMALSEKRAKSVGKYLESRGVAKERLVIKWFGESQPIESNDTAEGREKNRRVEMEVIFD